MDDQNNIFSDPSRIPEPQSTAPVVENTSYSSEQNVGPTDPTLAAAPGVDQVIAVEVEPQAAVQASAFSSDSLIPAPTAAPASFIALPSDENKSKKIWLWVLVGALILIGAFLVAIFVTAQQTANKMADNYTKAAISYVDKIHSDVNASGTSGEAKKVLDSDMAVKPQLKDEFMSIFSDKYTKAKALQSSVNDRIATFSTDIDGLAGVDNFINHNKLNATKIAAATTIINTATVEAKIVAALNDELNVLKDAQTTTAQVIFPSDLANAKNDLVNTYKDEVKYWTAFIAARKKPDAVAQAAALASFTTSTGVEAMNIDIVNKFYYDLAIKRNELLQNLDSYQKDLK